MTAYRTDLGVEVVNGWPVHSWECSVCGGARNTDCHECDGTGELVDRDCECGICLAITERESERLDREAEARRLPYALG